MPGMCCTDLFHFIDAQCFEVDLRWADRDPEPEMAAAEIYQVVE